MATLSDVAFYAGITVVHIPTNTYLTNVNNVGSCYTASLVTPEKSKDDVYANAVHISQPAAARDEWRAATDQERDSLWI